jgi:hypothetical protein
MKSFERAFDIIKEHKNPYPKDIFTWDNKEKMEITKGRFNQFVWSIVENVKHNLLMELIQELDNKEEEK